MCRFLFVGYSSGQRGQTVNLLANAFSGSNPLPTTNQLAFGEFFCFWCNEALGFPKSASPSARRHQYAADHRDGGASGSR